MFCRRQAICLALLACGAGLIVGSLISFCLPLCLLAAALIAAGVVWFRC